MKKIIGAGLIAFGFFAWVTFLFAGSGAALLICTLIIASGVIVLLKN